MERFKEKGIFNKHFLISLTIFGLVIMVVFTFISFLEDAQKKDLSFKKDLEGKFKAEIKK